MEPWIDQLRFGPDHLLPVIVQDARSGEVLTLAYANAEALRRTRESGEAWFYSRSRQELWHKGATSGNILQVEEIRWDCDADAVLYRVQPRGPACHTGAYTCFFNFPDQPPPVEPVQEDPGPMLMETLYGLIQQRRQDRPPGSYVTRLLEQGSSRVLQKVGEEAVETVLAGAEGDREALIREMADLWFHCLVALAVFDLTPGDVFAELRGRRR